MRLIPTLLVALPVLLLSSTAEGQSTCASDARCVPATDMAVFVKLLREKQCLQSAKPDVVFDAITLTEDKDGRVFASGANPLPYTVRLNWCSYEIQATGKLNVTVGRVEPETWGWRFRLKAAPGYLPLTALSEGDGYAGIDFGLLAEPFFFQWASVNGYVGVRSVGAGVGFDLTRNLGLHAGYAVTWGTWRHNPHVALSFALW